MRSMPISARSFFPLAFFALSAGPLAAQKTATAEDTARAIHLLSRATFGVRPGDIASVLSTGREAWLERQLHPDRIRDTLGPVLDQKYPLTTASMEDLYAEFAPKKAPAQAAQVTRARRAGRPDSMMMAMADTFMAAAKSVRAKGANPQSMLVDLAAAKIERAAMSDRQLEEVMTDFWFNHFNVFFQKGADRYLVADYERNAIRPYVFGKFEDMLVATAQHPAMLFYLDNWQSVHVDSSARSFVMRRMAPAQQAAAKQRQARGLNENYARELMELHTLGVDGGYTQQDVINVARALTGWTFTPPRGPAGGSVDFVFRPQLHDSGEKIVLGHKLSANRGMQDGRDVLHIVATHPSTAHFIATKLVEYFVNDKPQPELVNHIAAVFTKSGGDLREVTRALFTDPLFYDASNRGAKVKTPFQLVASALRVTDAQIVNGRGVLQTLRTMGQMPYMASPPTGYPASSADWVNSGALLARMNFGIDYASGKVPGVRLNGRALIGDGSTPLRTAEARILPGTDASKLEAAIVADAQKSQNSTTDPRARAARMIGLIIGSPEFQRH